MENDKPRSDSPDDATEIEEVMEASMDNGRPPSLLPEVTPELLREYQAERAAAARREREGLNHAEVATICGIPYYLFMALTALLVAVSTGTVVAVLYYDPLKETVLPPSRPPLADNSTYLDDDAIN